MKVFVLFFIVLHVKCRSHSSLSQHILQFYFFISKLRQKRTVVLNTLKHNSEWYLQPWMESQTNQKSFVFFLFSLNSPVSFIICRGGGGNSKDKKSTCFIITVHMKFNVLNHLNQPQLSLLCVIRVEAIHVKRKTNLGSLVCIVSKWKLTF